MSKEARALGFPVEHKHKLACLRQELIDSFVEARYVQFIKHAAAHLQILTKRIQKDKDSIKEKVSYSCFIKFLTKYRKKGKIVQNEKKYSFQEEKKEETQEKKENQEKKEQNNAIVDSNKEDSEQSSIEADEAKKIIESITDYTITGGEKQECKYLFLPTCFENFLHNALIKLFFFTHSGR